jgi:hypothetical protein
MARRNTRKYKKNRSHKKTKRMVGGEGPNDSNTEIPFDNNTQLAETPANDIPVVEETPANDIPVVEETPANDIPVVEETTVTETPSNEEETIPASETTDVTQETSETISESPLVEKDELTETILRIKTLINEKPGFEEYKTKLDNIDLNNIADKSKSIELFKSVEEKLQSLIGSVPAPSPLQQDSTSPKTETTSNESNKQKIPDGMVQILIPKENEHMIKECLIKKGCPVSEYNKDGDLITTNA